jgi:toxin ParE1/3/4
MILRSTTPARRDLIAILDYIAEDNPSAAFDVVDQIAAAALRLRDFPLSGREGELRETRELVIPGLSYLLIYRVREATIEILRVLHGAQQWPPA